MAVSFIDGKKTDCVSIFNRSFAFGDGIFETLKVINGEILYFKYHLDRLKKGINKLKLNYDYKFLIVEINKVLEVEKNCILKIIISRGESTRGYVFNQNIKAVISIITNDLPQIAEEVSLKICTSGYYQNPNLAGIKHQNRLEQIMACGHNSDCIMLDNLQNVISTTYANIFIVKNNIISTPNLDDCGILGTRRAVILDNFSVVVKVIQLNELFTADEIFITNSVIGIQRIMMINGIFFTKTKTFEYVQKNISF